ncbi:MAG: ATP-binding protein [Firmicutes bacterium]|nr:ATP-binding protein [Bacillota bacterium]
MQLTSAQKVICVGVLSFLSWLGSYFALPLFFGVDFVFSSVFALLAGLLFSPLIALVVGVIGASYTLWLWGHPYAWLIFSLEAWLVSLLVWRLRTNLVLAAGLYWLVIGAPLVVLTYAFGLGMESGSVLFVAIKQALNGIGNALLAGALLLCFGASSRLRTLFGLGLIKLKHVLFFTFMIIIMISGGAAILHDVRELSRTHLTYAESAVSSKADFLVDQLIIDEPILPPLREGFSGTAILAANGDVLAQRGHLHASELDTTEGFAGARLFMPSGNMSAMTRWKRSYVYALVPGPDDLFVLVEMPLAPIAQALEQSRLRGFVLLFGLVGLGLIASSVITNRMTRSLDALDLASQQIGRSLGQLDRVEYPRSHIAEYQRVSLSMQQMAAQIRRLLQAQEQQQSQLEADIQQAVEEAEATGEMLTRVFNTATQVAMVVTDQDGFIQVFNPGAERLFGYSAERAINSLNIRHLLYQRSGNLLVSDHLAFSALQDTLAASKRFDVHGTRADGSQVAIDVTMSPLDSRFLILAKDISQELESERLKSEFVATVSHELRTPLTAIIGTLSLLQNGVGGALNEKGAKLMTVAEANAQRLKLLINDLLDLEGISSGQIQFHMAPCNLHDIVEQAVRLYAPSATSKQVTFRINQRSGRAVRIEADTDRLLQALGNLLSNAVKFSPQNAVIELRIELNDATRQVQVSVCDQGPGIPTAFRGKIFTRFSQADASDKRERGGTGLGLAITKDLIENMGGTIGFESEPGQGACFWIRFDVLSGIAPEL